VNHRANQVRAAIAAAPETFTLRGICKLAGAHESEKDALRQLLKHLCVKGELTMDEARRGGIGATYRRTAHFRAEEPAADTQPAAGEFLQALSLAWGAARPSDRVRYVPEPHVD
jgi:hypothetical protein